MARTGGVKTMIEDQARRFTSQLPRRPGGPGLRTVCETCTTHADHYGVCPMCERGELKYLTHDPPAPRHRPSRDAPDSRGAAA